MKPLNATAWLVALLLAIGLAGCSGDEEEAADTDAPDATAPANGGDGDDSGDTDASGAEAGEPATVEITADPDGSLAYTETELSAPAGDVIIEFENPANVQHDVAVNDPSGEMIDKTAVITDDAATLMLEDLEPGSYQYWCSVPGHLEAGMEGTLTIE